MTAAPIASLGVAARLRSATAATHEQAEGDGLLARIVAGQLDASAYAALVTQLRAVYDALERTGAELARDLIAGRFIDDSLHRTTALQDDLAWLASQGAAARHPVLPATRAYADRIEATRTRPLAYVAHHYTRYLGDLSGGQHIGRAVARHLGEAAASFYRFDPIEDLRAYKTGYRARLDALELDEGDLSQLIDEVQVAYACNGAMFGQVATLLGDVHGEARS